MSRKWEHHWLNKSPFFLGHPKYIEHPGRQLAYRILGLEGGTLLDAGCCMGRDYLYLQRYNIKYTGIDITPKFIERFRENHPNVDVRLASILNIPFNDGRFTSVYCGDVLQHLHPKEYTLAIKEMWRVITNLMILVIPTFVEKEIINYHQKKVYLNQFNKDKFLKNITVLKNVESVKLEENIKGPEQASMTLVIVRKRKSE